MQKYHISKNGEVAPCKATKRACTAQAQEGLEQFHSTNENDVRAHMDRQYQDIYEAVNKPITRGLPTEITNETIGNPTTDHERLDKFSIGEEKFGSKFMETFMRDTEGRPIAFVKLLDNKGKITLCDIEVREEYRGRKLGQRLVKAVEKNLGKPIGHDGGYTAAGRKAIAPLFHNESELTELERKDYEPMNFVIDWERAYPKYPL